MSSPEPPAVSQGLSTEASSRRQTSPRSSSRATSTTADLPDPDLLIRTGGEERISNYLLWQAAYSELFFSPVYWPDFGKAPLEAALEAYASRERRFGKTSEQIQLED